MMLPSRLSAMENRVEGSDKGWAARRRRRRAAGDVGRWKVATGLPGGTNCSPPVQGPE